MSMALAWLLFNKKNYSSQVFLYTVLEIKMVFSLNFWHEIFFKFCISDINIKVQIYASGTDKINVLPQKGTVHLQQNIFLSCLTSQFAEMIWFPLLLCFRWGWRWRQDYKSRTRSASTFWILLQGLVEAVRWRCDTQVPWFVRCRWVLDEQSDQHVWRLDRPTVVWVPHRSGSRWAFWCFFVLSWFISTLSVTCIYPPLPRAEGVQPAQPQKRWPLPGGGQHP